MPFRHRVLPRIKVNPSPSYVKDDRASYFYESRPPVTGSCP